MTFHAALLLIGFPYVTNLVMSVVFCMIIFVLQCPSSAFAMRTYLDCVCNAGYYSIEYKSPKLHSAATQLCFSSLFLFYRHITAMRFFSQKIHHRTTPLSFKKSLRMRLLSSTTPYPCTKYSQKQICPN
jgi:hypothetical protein